MGDGPFEVGASASSGLPVAYEVLSGPATVVENKVTLTGGGTVVLRASQAGNDNWKAAEALKNVEVGKAMQSITFGYLASRAFTSDSIQLGASASSGLSVVYQVMVGEAELFGEADRGGRGDGEGEAVG